MSRQYPRARTGEDRTSLYDEITNKIIAELEAGRDFGGEFEDRVTSEGHREARRITPGARGSLRRASVVPIARRIEALET